MNKTLSKKIAVFLPSLVSGILVVLSFPAFKLYLLAWIAFLPLLWSLWYKNPKQAFASGFVFGLVFFFGTLYWIYHSINHYGGVSLPASISLVLLLCSYLSLYPAMFAFLFSLLIKKTKLPALFIAPVIWVVLEFARSYAFSGFPWSSIGYSQYKFLSIIQIADITGIYGISFLILAVNGALIDLFLLKERLKNMPLFPLSYNVVGFVSLLLILLLSLGYGKWRLGQERPGNDLRAAIVQGNIDQNRKWDPAFQQEVLDIHFSLSAEASLAGADLIVWAETAAPFFFKNDTENTEKLVRFQKELGVPLLFGSVLLKDPAQNQFTNSALLLDPEGKTIYKYDKIHLVPFGEYVPFRSVLFFIDKIVVGIGDYIPGNKYTQGVTGKGSFATLICYEIIFPGMVRKFYQKGGDFIVNITNDAWFGMTSGPHQHFSMGVFRAIENRKPVVRSANTGISGYIDSNGRILSQTQLFKRQFLTSTIKTDATKTFYTKYGDLFSYLCIVISVVLLLNTNIWRK